MFGQIGGQQGIGGPLSPNSIGGESFIRHIGNDKLIFDFKSGSGTTVKDKSREGNDGTFGAGAAAPTWKRNGLYFDGGDYVACATLLDVVPSGITLEMFYEVTAKTGNIMSLFGKSNIASEDRIRVELLDNNTLKIFHEQNNDGGIYYSISNWSLNAWEHRMVTWGSNGMWWFKNGSYDGKNVSDTILMNDGTYTDFYIGQSYTGASRFKGLMKSFRVYGETLSQIEVQQECLINKFAGNN